jgi:hypothetical protein
MAYIGAPPLNRVLSSADIAQGAVTLDDINFTDQPVNMDITGVIDKHTMRLADGVTITGDVTISDDLVLSKISDDGNAITMTNDGSSRTITGSGSIEASTLSQTPNQSLTGMTGTVGSAVTGSPALNLGNATFPTGHIIQVRSMSKTDTFQYDSTSASEVWVDITGMTYTITPKTDNDVLITAVLIISGENGMAWNVRLVRGTTPIGIGDAAGSRPQSTISGRANEEAECQSFSVNYLDTSPGGDGSTVITYKFEVEVENNGTFTLNKSKYDNDDYLRGRSISTITLMEIAG